MVDKSFRDAARDAVGKPTPEELRELDEQGQEGAGAAEVRVKPEAEVAREDPAVAELAPDEGADSLPAWAQQAIPQGLEVPMGRTLVVMRFRAEWTDARHLGDRTCVVWNLSVGDEKLANSRAGDNVFSNTMEMAKQMIRAIDGAVIDYSGKTRGASVDHFWNEIGKKCRGMVISHFVRAHSLTLAEKMDFLARCLVARTNLPATGVASR